MGLCSSSNIDGNRNGSFFSLLALARTEMFCHRSYTLYSEEVDSTFPNSILVRLLFLLFVVLREFFCRIFCKGLSCMLSVHRYIFGNDFVNALYACVKRQRIYHNVCTFWVQCEIPSCPRSSISVNNIAVPMICLGRTFLNSVYRLYLCVSSYFRDNTFLNNIYLLGCPYVA